MMQEFQLEAVPWYQGEPFVRATFFLGCLVILGALQFFGQRSENGRDVKRTIVNFGLGAFGAVGVRLLGPATAVAAASWANYRGWGLFSVWEVPLVLQVFVSLLVLDLAIFAQHVASHHVSVLWRIHRVHHSDPDITLSSGVRFHPVEIVLSMLFKAGIVVLLGAPIIAVIVFEIVLNAMSMFTHTRIRIPRGMDRVLRVIIVTPAMHLRHHGVLQKEQRSNYGFHVSFWDRLFATYSAKPPRDGKIGLDDMTRDRAKKFAFLIRLPFVSTEPAKQKSRV